jgi:hypothetical protein
MITGMLVFGAGLSLRRNIVLSAAILLSAASATAAASPSDLQQASALYAIRLPRPGSSPSKARGGSTMV